MGERKELLAYCGSYCSDCLGHTGVVADAASDFKTVLDNYKFGRTAGCVFPQTLKDYKTFYKALVFMTSLRCNKICREREDSATSCEVRICCRERGLYACHECDDFENCDKLGSLMGGLHTDSNLKNLRAINEMGLEAWIIEGKRYSYWDEPVDDP